MSFITDENIVIGQGKIFLYAVLLGFFVGLLYDVFEILRFVFCNKKTAVALFDVLYFFVIAIVIFIFTLVTNFGQVRIFIVVGIVIGATFYFLTGGKLFKLLGTSVKKIYKKEDK